MPTLEDLKVTVEKRAERFELPFWSSLLLAVKRSVHQVVGDLFLDSARLVQVLVHNFEYTLAFGKTRPQN
jgi:hypothetical protein